MKELEQIWMGMGVSTFVICDLIYMPICIFHCYKFNQNIEDVIIQKRYGKVSFYEAIFSILKLFLNGLIFLYLGLPSLPVHHLLYCTATGVSNSLSICLHYCLFWRFFLLHFDIQNIIANINGKWQSLIDPNHMESQSDNNYFLRNKKTCGNYQWFKTRIMIPALLLSCSIQIISCTTVGVYAHIYKWDTELTNAWVERSLLFNSPFYIWPGVALVVIWFRTPRLEDQFFISQELGKLCKIVIVYLSFWVSCRIVLSIEGYDDAEHTLIVLWIQTIATHSCIFMTVMVSTFWVNKKIILTRSRASPDRELVPMVNRQSISKQVPKKNTISQVLSRVLTFSTYPDIEDEDTTMTTVDATGIVKLTAILSHPKGFELFMRHLSTEFSIENLLSLVEFLQFQEMMYQSIINNDQFKDYVDTDHSLWCQKISIPSNVPKSHIIFEGQEMTDLVETFCECDETQFIGVVKKIAYNLYLKYIATSSELEVNVAYRTRVKLIELMNDAGKWMDNQQIGIYELLHVYDESCNQIYGLMGDSYRRFQKTSQYLVVKSLVLV